MPPAPGAAVVEEEEEQATSFRRQVSGGPGMLRVVPYRANHGRRSGAPARAMM